MSTLINSLMLDTRWGARHFDVREGDVVELEEPIGVLVVSAFAGDYTPTASSVVGALARRFGIEVGRHARSPAFDFRSALGGWMSHELDPCVPLRRILCLEMTPGMEVREAAENLFAIASAVEAKCGPRAQLGSIAVPMIGAGDQGRRPENVIAALVEVTQLHIETLRSVSRVTFVVRGRELADCVARAMDEALGRIRVVVPAGDAARSARVELKRLVDLLAVRREHEALARDLRALWNDDVHVALLGVLGRRVAEAITRDLGQRDDVEPRGARQDLAGAIDALRPRRAEWIVHYLHLLRVFGNEAAHDKGGESRHPTRLEEEDITLLLMCLTRLMTYWMGVITN